MPGFELRMHLVQLYGITSITGVTTVLLSHDTWVAGTGSMPAWMSLLHGSMASSDAPLYARLFLVKAVLHVEARHTARMAATGEQDQVRQTQTNIPLTTPNTCLPQRTLN